MAEQVLKIGVFYDGNYLYHVSNYYAYRHELHARLSISGLHQFIRERVAHFEQTSPKYCHIVDAHYFRGRYSTQIIEQKGWLRGERIFEDVLMYNGVTTHYWPMMEGNEKSVDVALALEAYELTVLKKFDVCVVIAGDGDYAPLVKKLNNTGTRVMVLGWDFDFTDDRGVHHETRVSRALLSEATFPIVMSDIINKGLYGIGARCSLFVSKNLDEAETEEEVESGAVDFGNFEDASEGMDEESDGKPELRSGAPVISDISENVEPDEKGELLELTGRVILLNRGWGFIRPDEHPDNSLEVNDIYFRYADLENCSFDSLRHGDFVRFCLGTNERGFIARRIRREEY